MVTPREPPGVFTVTLGHPELCVVDDDVWSLPAEGAPRCVAEVEAWGASRVIRGEVVVGLGDVKGERGSIGR